MSGPAHARHAREHPTPYNPRFDELPLEKRQKLLSEFTKTLKLRLDATPPPRPTRLDMAVIVGSHVILLILSYISDGQLREFRPSETRLLFVVGVLSVALLISRPLLLWWKRKNLLSQIRAIEDQRQRLQAA